MADLSKTERFYLAHCVLLLTTFIAATVVTFVLMFLARRRGDPARWSMTLIKFAAVSYCLFCFLDFSSDVVFIAFSRMVRSANQGKHDNLDLLVTLLRLRIELDAAARLADCITVAFVFLAIIFLTIGITIVRRGVSGRGDKIIKYVSYTFALALALIATAAWAIRVRLYLDYHVAEDADDEFDVVSDNEEYTERMLNASRQLDFSFVIISWAMALVTLGRSARIWVTTRFGKHLDPPLVYLMLCCVAWLLRSTYELVYQLKFVNFRDSDAHAYKHQEPNYLEITEVVLDMWSIFAIICLMLALGVKKKRGIWSIPPPQTSGDIPLEDMDPSPPAYSSATTPPAQDPHPSTAGAASSGAPLPPGVVERDQQNPGETPYDLAQDDRELVEALGLGGSSEQYQPYSQAVLLDPGIGSSSSGCQADPVGGPGPGAQLILPPPPPPHDEAMGLNHQADGRPPQTAPLPYPEKN